MPAGRPSAYNAEILEKAKQYVESGYINAGHQIPTIAGLSKTLNVHRDTIYGWAEDPEKEEFSDTLSKIKSEQEIVLLSKGLTGDFNGAIAKLVLHNHGYHDKVDNTLSSPGGGPVEWSFVGVPPSGARSKQE